MLDRENQDRIISREEEEIIDYINEGYISFYIRVVDNSGKGVKDVHIECEDCIPVNDTETDYLGEVTINIDKATYPDIAQNGLSFAVYKNGYYEFDGYANLGTSKRYPCIVTINQVSNRYYYVVYVKNNRNEYVSGATVQAYTSDLIDDHTDCVNDSELLTDFSGKYTFSEGDGRTLYFRASKNGYVTSELVAVHPQSSITDAEKYAVTITINATSSADYYYIVKVVNENGAGMPGMDVGLYKDISMSNFYETSQSNLIRGIVTTTSGGDAKPTALEIFNEIREIIANITGEPTSRISLDCKYAEELAMTPLTVTKVMSAIEQTYRIVFAPVGGFSAYATVDEKADYFTGLLPFINDIVLYVYDNADFATSKTVKYTTDDTGFIVISLGNLSGTTRPIYARGLVDSYIWNVRQGTVPSTTGEDVPGIVLSVMTGSTPANPVGTYYYNVQLFDAYTQNPVKDATVTYLKNGVEVSSQKSGESGKVNYTNTSNKLSIKITKDGYNDETVSTVLGAQESNKYTRYDLMQQNPIQVVYGYGEYEAHPIPAPNIVVGIGYYDSKNNYIDCGKYKSAESGYIDGVSYGYFASGGYTYYAVVQNYVPADETLKSSLKKRLVLGGLTIVLPEPYSGSGGGGEEEISDEEYVQFYDMSANAIRNNVNKGNLELASKQTTDKVSYAGGNNYRINVLDPDSITTYDIFQSKPVMMENNHRSVIGSIDIGLKYDVNKLKLKIINRYSGYYNPIFKDVLFYKNLFFNNDELPFSNVAFDYEYKDKYGKFGVINNMWFHKVNEDKGINIINTATPYYPLTGQYALDYRDYNIFESNWDMEHYTKQLDIEHSKPCPNISSQKNGICMFGSKYLNVPNKIEIYGFTLGDDDSWAGEWNDDWITNPDACPGEVMYKEINDNSVDYYFFLTKRIHRFFYDKLKDEFEKYMNVDSGSYGKPGVEDDIREYVTKNVLKLYKLDKVRVFVKRTKKGQHNSRIENDYTKYLEYDKTSGDPAITEYFENMSSTSNNTGLWR